MTQAEFIESHGSEAWDQLVKPLKQRPKAPAIDSLEHIEAAHGNTLVHTDIGFVLRQLGFEKNSLLAAKEEIARLRAVQ